MLLLCAQAVAQLFSSLQACLFSLRSTPGSSLYVNLVAVDHLLQAGVLTFQSAQPLLQILYQPCKLSICRPGNTVCLPGITEGFCTNALLHDKAQHHTSLPCRWSLMDTDKIKIRLHKQAKADSRSCLAVWQPCHCDLSAGHDNSINGQLQGQSLAQEVWGGALELLTATTAMHQCSPPPRELD